MAKNFDNLGINDDILKGVYLYGFKEPSPIQLKGIESINTGKDCILQSQSGTGKTATYLLGVFNKIKKNKHLQAIVLTPTRELATQVYNVAIQISKYSNLNIALKIGGSNDNYSFNNINLVIGTLGRINHILSNKINKCDMCNLLVIDEADNMFMDGITEDLTKLLNKLPENTQKVLISATLSRNIFNLEDKLLKDPIKILLKKSEVAVELISQFYIDVEVEEYKFDVLIDLHTIMSTTQVIIFCNTIRKVTWLSEKLTNENFDITAIHGNMTQQERNNIVKEFRDGKTRLLLTTDLLARGIDIPQVNLVINYDLPVSKETYIHRIGRCGRFRKKGVSITMVKMEDSNDVRLLNKMKNHYKLNIDEIPENIGELI
jgi:superfamily II DNA/RNA helicase